MKEKICGIYMIQNKINGKIYIGQSINIYQRWMSHKSNKLSTYISNAFSKYSIENFSFSILEKCEKSELNNRECFYIKLYHSTDKEFGYNLMQGGYNHEWSNEMKQKNSKISKKLWQNDDYRKRLSESHKGKSYNKNNNLVKCIETNEIKTIFEWRSLGYNSVTNVCKGKLKQTKGYSFEFVDESLRPTEENIIEYKNKRKKKENFKNKRLCLDPITNLPISYSSLSQKKQTKEEYKNIILKDCLIIDEKELEYYTNIRNDIRTMPYTYSNEKERRTAWEEKNKEKERLRGEKRRKRLCLDPITNEKIRYDKLKYRRKTNPLYKDVILKDCIIQFNTKTNE